MNIKFAVKIVGALSKSIGAPMTILQISKSTGLSYNATNRTVHALISEGVIESTTVGHSKLLKLTDTAKTIGFIKLAEAYEEEE